MVTVVLLTQNSSKFTLSIFHFVAFINNDVFPVIFIESETILKYKIICCNAYVPFCAFHWPKNFISCCRIASIYNFSDWRSPFIKLRHPVRNCWERDNNKERTIVFLELNKVRKQWDGLNSLSETHFIRQNSIQIIIVQRHQPLKAH